MVEPQGNLPLEALVGELVRQVRASQRDAEDEVLLDLEVGGVRCLLVRLPDAAETAAPTLGHLSAREQEIARMVAKGYPNKIIAAVLEISCWTVNTHLRRIFAKLGVHSRAAMVARLLEDAAHKSSLYAQAPRDGDPERENGPEDDRENGHGAGGLKNAPITASRLAAVAERRRVPL